MGSVIQMAEEGEKKPSVSEVAKELKAIREEQAATRRELMALRKQVGDIPVVDVTEVPGILAAQGGQDEFLCGSCNAPVDKGEATCKACGAPLDWPSE